LPFSATKMAEIDPLARNPLQVGAQRQVDRPAGVGTDSGKGQGGHE
jgi:hypothetical protein